MARPDAGVILHGAMPGSLVVLQVALVARAVGTDVAAEQRLLAIVHAHMASKKALPG